VSTAQPSSHPSSPLGRRMKKERSQQRQGQQRQRQQGQGQKRQGGTRGPLGWGSEAVEGTLEAEPWRRGGAWHWQPQGCRSRARQGLALKGRACRHRQRQRRRRRARAQWARGPEAGGQWEQGAEVEGAKGEGEGVEGAEIRAGAEATEQELLEGERAPKVTAGERGHIPTPVRSKPFQHRTRPHASPVANTVSENEVALQEKAPAWSTGSSPGTGSRAGRTGSSACTGSRAGTGPTCN